jgi:hypothetical protein
MKKTFIFIFISFILIGCSESEHIPANQYGVLLEFGKYKTHFKGPITIEKTKVKHYLIKFNIDNELTLGSSKIKILYRVTNPKKYSINFGGNKDSMQRWVEKRAVNKAVETGQEINKEFIIKILLELNDMIKVIE